MVEEVRDKNGGETQKKRPRGKPFEKGNKLGHGRPTKEHSVTQALRELAPEILEITIGGKKNTTRTAVQLMALGMYLKAIQGDASMAREIIDRLEGKVAQPLSGVNGEPIQHSVTINVVSEQAKELTTKILSGARTS